MDAVVDADDRLARRDEAPRLFRAQAARVGQAQVRAADLVQARHVLLRRDDRDQERTILRGAPHLFDLDAIGGGVEPVEVVHDLRPVRELAVRAGPEPEDGLGRGRRGRRRRGDGQEE